MTLEFDKSVKPLPDGGGPQAQAQESLSNIALASIEAYSKRELSPRAPEIAVAWNDRSNGQSNDRDSEPRNMTGNQRLEWQNMTRDERWRYQHLSPNEQWTRDHLNRNEKWDYDRMTPNERWDYDHRR
jgi:hypothetical protein